MWFSGLDNDEFSASVILLWRPVKIAKKAPHCAGTHLKMHT